MQDTRGPDTSEDIALAMECCSLANQLLETALQAPRPQRRLELQKALQFFMIALELRPRHLDAYLGLAYLSALSDAYSQADDALAQAARLAPGDPRIAVLQSEISALKQSAPPQPDPTEHSLAELIGSIDFGVLDPAELQQTSRRVLAHLEQLNPDSPNPS